MKIRISIKKDENLLLMEAYHKEEIEKFRHKK